MTDREKIIKGLECCSQMTGEACRKCPYSSECVAGEATYQTGTAHLASDALALLKEQEPRLLTLDEVCGGGECWIEGINGACGYADCEYDFDNDSGIYDVEIYRTHRKTIASSKGFGKAWRGWSVKPTDEQRKAVKWDGARQSEGGGDSGD